MRVPSSGHYLPLLIVRVEAEAVSSKLTVVHNYGHCGYGVLSSPGTGQEAVNLVRRAVKDK